MEIKYARLKPIHRHCLQSYDQGHDVWSRPLLYLPPYLPPHSLLSPQACFLSLSPALWISTAVCSLLGTTASHTPPPSVSTRASLYAPRAPLSPCPQTTLQHDVLDLSDRKATRTTDRISALCSSPFPFSFIQRRLIGFRCESFFINRIWWQILYTSLIWFSFWEPFSTIWYFTYVLSFGFFSSRNKSPGNQDSEPNLGLFPSFKLFLFSLLFYFILFFKNGPLQRMFLYPAGIRFTSGRISTSSISSYRENWCWPIFQNLH